MPRFTPPTPAAVAAALDDRRRGGPPPALAHYAAWLRAAAAGGGGAGGAALFRPPPRPRAGDWLAEHDERGQTVASYARTPMHASPHGPFDTVALLPVGGDVPGAPPLRDLLDSMARFAGAYYGVRVEILPSVAVAELGDAVPTRPHDDYGRQLHAGDLARYAQRRARADRALSRRCVATACVTFEDLYPRDEWNFVFGIADAAEGAAAVSLRRYVDAGDAAVVALRRACKVLAHELGHLFGLRHCIHFACLMSGSNHLAELDRNALHLCPVCLAKLLGEFRWDLRARSAEIRGVMGELGCFTATDVAEAAAQAEGLARHAAEHGPPPGAVDWRAPRAPPARPAAGRRV